MGNNYLDRIRSEVGPETLGAWIEQARSLYDRAMKGVKAQGGDGRQSIREPRHQYINGVVSLLYDEWKLTQSDTASSESSREPASELETTVAG